MATVPELKTQATALGIKGISRMRKPELEAAITAAKLEAIQQAPIKPESVTREVSMPTEADRKAERREAARLAGSRAKVTVPMSHNRRSAAYLSQSGRWTHAQSRRANKKLNRAQSRRVLAAFDEMIADANRKVA